MRTLLVAASVLALAPEVHEECTIEEFEVDPQGNVDLYYADNEGGSHAVIVPESAQSPELNDVIEAAEAAGDGASSDVEVDGSGNHESIDVTLDDPGPDASIGGAVVGERLEEITTPEGQEYDVARSVPESERTLATEAFAAQDCVGWDWFIDSSTGRRTISKFYPCEH